MADPYYMVIADAYREMDLQLNYRPVYTDEADFDALGPVTDDEAFEYAVSFRKTEDGCWDMAIGCSDWATCKALVYTIEAAKCCCGGDRERRKLGVELLEMAIKEMKNPTTGDRRYSPCRPIDASPL
jgi:hypothetical protein